MADDAHLPEWLALVERSREVVLEPLAQGLLGRPTTELRLRQLCDMVVHGEGAVVDKGVVPHGGAESLQPAETVGHSLAERCER